MVIQKETGYQNIVSWPLELSDFASTKAFADRFDREGGGRLDILVTVLNTGVTSFDYNPTGDGYEAQVQVNHLSGSLVALRLLSTLLATAEQNKTISRLVIVSSGAHYPAKLGVDRFSAGTEILKTLSAPENGTEEAMMTRGQFEEDLKTARTTEEGSRQLIIAALGPRDVTDTSEWSRSSEAYEVQERIWNETWDILSKVDESVNKTAALFSSQ
ncbi:hypothetical protein EUX98_g1572 [Antrodiella citrinella]|uniref:Uncharacterized protein n=1 Tax=Antrodiella citrinella TaxID=2447956 RepID=A0A4S4N141_9APHY|nr:hypothetical protein EUX98_g1572 [Antrodiella citrinella]